MQLTREFDKLPENEIVEFNDLLEKIRRGDPGAFDALVYRTYGRIRNIASVLIGGRHGTQSFAPSDLVGESFKRILESRFNSQINDIRHYFSLFSRVMKQILLDHHKAKNSLKRGKHHKQLCFDLILSWMERQDQSIELLADALDSLRNEIPEAAETLELRYFGFMTETEICVATNSKPWMVQKNLRLAKAYVRNEIEQG